MWTTTRLLHEFGETENKFGGFLILEYEPLIDNPVLQNDEMSPLFMAVIEATEEAIINSLFAAKTVTGRNGNKAEALPLDKVIPILKKYNHIQK